MHFSKSRSFIKPGLLLFLCLATRKKHEEAKWENNMLTSFHLFIFNLMWHQARLRCLKFRFHYPGTMRFLSQQPAAAKLHYQYAPQICFLHARLEMSEIGHLADRRVL